MKKLILVCSMMVTILCVQAQNEGRLGIYCGINKTSLSNADDKAQNDYLPTFKPSMGVSAGYHFTLFKAIPTGFTLEVGTNRLGQNYRGYYADTTDYWAYSRLNYLRMGLGWHIGTNPRRMASVTLTNGVTFGILQNYQERYELVRRNNDKSILDIKNTTVVVDDTLVVKGTLSAPLYNKTDMTYFASLSGDFLLSKHITFGVLFRYDMGLSPVENITNYTIYFNTEPASTTVPYKPYSKFKYRAPLTPNETRAQTVNTFMGVYFTLKYRIYNEDKHRMWYKEHRHDWF